MSKIKTMDIVNEKGYLSSKDVNFLRAIELLLGDRIVASPKSARALMEFFQGASPEFKEELMKLALQEDSRIRTSKPKSAGLVDHDELTTEMFGGLKG